jgi:hypothetical protein
MNKLIQDKTTYTQLMVAIYIVKTLASQNINEQ